MSNEFLPTERQSALDRLEEWLNEGASTYARDRNRVVPGHTNVSRLSAALRRRSITEREVIAATLTRFDFHEAERYLQEVAWRLYWKSWLEMRPAVWDDYRNAVESAEGWQSIIFEDGKSSGVAIIDHFAQELIDTGYLHNHARMWFAAWWIHEARLPWEQGADFFLRHLHDGDPASNTLSWRWVAGLHTRGKTYLARRSNLEKNIAADILEPNLQGLEKLESPIAREDLAEQAKDYERFAPAIESIDRTQISGKAAIWLHKDDQSFHLSKDVEGIQAIILNCSPDDLPQAAVSQGIKSIIAAQPWIGSLNDHVLGLRQELAPLDITLYLHRREADRDWLPLATAGFFGFWKKFKRKILNH